MWATGAPKLPSNAAKSEGKEETSEETSEEKESTPVEQEAEEEEDMDVDRDPREVLKDLRAKAKSILATSKQDIGAKRKQDLRAFSKSIKKLLSKTSSNTVLTDSLEAQFVEIQNQLNIRRSNQTAGTTSLPSGNDSSTEGSSEDTPKQPPKEEIVLNDAEYNELYAALRSMQENPIDESKPYATPWMPRPYMSAFAFVPRFLEVNHNICGCSLFETSCSKAGACRSSQSLCCRDPQHGLCVVPKTEVEVCSLVTLYFYRLCLGF